MTTSGYGAYGDSTGDVRYAAGTASLTATSTDGNWSPNPYEQDLHRREQEMRKMEQKMNPQMSMGVDPAVMGNSKVVKRRKTPLDDLRRSVSDWLTPTLRALSV